MVSADPFYVIKILSREGQFTYAKSTKRARKGKSRGVSLSSGNIAQPHENKTLLHVRFRRGI